MRETIWKASCLLLAEAAIDDIRTSDIISKASISRSSFYRRFFDKYDVVNWGFKGIYDHTLTPRTPAEIAGEASWHRLLVALQDNRNVALHAFSGKDPNGLRDFTIEYLRTLLRDVIRMLAESEAMQEASRAPNIDDHCRKCSVKPPPPGESQQELLFKMTSIGITDFVINWLEKPSFNTKVAARAIAAMIYYPALHNE